MHKSIFTILFAALFVSSAFGQSSKFRLGVLGGGGIHYLASDHAGTDGGAKLLGHYGAAVEFYFSDKYALVSGLEIARRGGSLSNLGIYDAQGTLIQNYDAEYNVGFVQVPIMVMMRSRQVGYWTYFAQFGGALAFRTGESVRFSPDVPGNDDEKSYSNPLNATFRFALGAEYDMGNFPSLQVSLQYHRSLFDNLRADRDFRLEKQYHYRFDAVSLGVGIFF